jgi:hypothetical protein
VGTVEQNINFWLGSHPMHLNINTTHVGKGHAEGIGPNEEELQLYSRGFLLADGSGLGKTTVGVTLALASGPLVEPPGVDDDAEEIDGLVLVDTHVPTLINPHMVTTPLDHRKLFYTRASLVYIKKEVLIGPNGWYERAKLLFPQADIRVISTRQEYANLTYKQLASADLVIVTSNVVMGPLISDTMNRVKDYELAQFMTGETHPLLISETYHKGIKASDTSPHLGLFLWQRLFVDEAHEAVNLPMPADYHRFLCSTAFAHVKYFITATPWANGNKHYIPDSLIKRVFGDFLGLYAAPRNTTHSVQTLRRATLRLLLEIYGEKKSTKDNPLLWTQYMGPHKNSSMRPGFLAHAIQKACLHAIVSRNTQESTQSEVAHATLHEEIIRVPIPRLLFQLDRDEIALGVPGSGLQKYVSHTKAIVYKVRTHVPVLVTISNLEPCTPQAAADNLRVLAQKLLDQRLSHQYNTHTWIPATLQGAGYVRNAVNPVATRIDQIMKSTYANRMPKDSRVGPFPAFTVNHVMGLLAKSPTTKVILATKQRILIKALVQEFKAHKVVTCVLGATNLITAKKNLTLFQTEARVMMLHAVKASAGINLQMANYLILLDPPDEITPADRKQLIGRFHRQGQLEENIYLHHLVPEEEKTPKRVLEDAEPDDREPKKPKTIELSSESEA